MIVYNGSSSNSTCYKPFWITIVCRYLQTKYLFIFSSYLYMYKYFCYISIINLVRSVPHRNLCLLLLFVGIWKLFINILLNCVDKFILIFRKNILRSLKIFYDSSAQLVELVTGARTFLSENCHVKTDNKWKRQLTLKVS